MLRNYLLTAWNVFMRRKLFSAINLVCIVLTLVVLMVITALLESAFYPTGVEGKSDRMLQVIGLRAEAPPLGPKQQFCMIGGPRILQRFLPPGFRDFPLGAKS